jgi:hypothetical protein
MTSAAISVKGKDRATQQYINSLHSYYNSDHILTICLSQIKQVMRVDRVQI